MFIATYKLAESQVDNRFTDLEVARHRVAAPPRPHDLDELGVVGRNLSVHSERVVAVQLLPPLVGHEVFGEGTDVAQALEGKGLTGTGEQRVKVDQAELKQLYGF